MCNCTKSGSLAKSISTKTIVASPPVSYSPSFQSKRKKARTAVKEIPSFKIEPLENISEEGLAEKCLSFAYVLGLEKAVPENVLIAAIEDQNYAQRLFMNRNEPYLYELLNNPPELLSGRMNTQSFSSNALIAKAGKALLNWGLSGFPTVSKNTLQAREDACLTCPNLVAATKILQKITATYKISDQIGKRTGNKSCSVCGCVVQNKIRLETETCPEEVLATPGLNRWGESLPTK